MGNQPSGEGPPTLGMCQTRFVLRHNHLAAPNNGFSRIPSTIQKAVVGRVLLVEYGYSKAYVNLSHVGGTLLGLV